MNNTKEKMYICTNCGNRGNTSHIEVIVVKNDHETRKKQLENMERKVREHNIKKSKIPFLKTKLWSVEPIYDEILKKDFYMVCEDNGMSLTGYTMWKSVTKDKVIIDKDFLYINCPKCKERVYLGMN